jgi:hypothetical protein
MKYIFEDSGNPHWRYIAPQEDIFSSEIFARKQEQPPSEIVALDISASMLSMIRGIVRYDIGTNNVLEQSAEALIKSFSSMVQEIREMQDVSDVNIYYRMNPGALTGLRGTALLDQNDQLTSSGVSVFKYVARVIKSQECKPNQK